MSRKSEPIICRGFFPDGMGGYVEDKNLTPEQMSEWSEKLVQRMGRTLNDWFSQHPEEYTKL